MQAVLYVPDGTTAPHWASYRDDVESADLLIRAGARVNAATDLGVTPLWTASLNGSEAMVRRLLAAGANPNAALRLGETPVMVASRSGHPLVVEQLTANGAHVNARAARIQREGFGRGDPAVWDPDQGSRAEMADRPMLHCDAL